ncbi:NAD dependent epimerase/dehydratase [Xylariaceae sp. FL0255]|nr:NAD dependent epimerase/dehydratase [Xylariaceae sp. FL0255]
MAPLTYHVLLVGATGYIGGTVLNRLMKTVDSLSNIASLSFLIRGQEKAEKLKKTYGNRIKPVFFDTLDNTANVSEICSHYDIVVNAGTGFHPLGAEAMVQGLGKRLATTRNTTWMIQSAGGSNVYGKPITDDPPQAPRSFDDANGEEMYEFMKTEQARDPYPQREAELRVIEAGLQTGVKTISVHVPTVVGHGEGAFAVGGVQVPQMMHYVLEKGYGFQFGDGSAILGICNVSDLADVYILLLRHVLTDGGVQLPTGKAGMIIPHTARITVRDLALGCLEAAFARGILPKLGGPRKMEVRQVSVQQIGDELFHGNYQVAEKGWGGYWIHMPTLARKLGWKPTKIITDWSKEFEDELDAVLEGQRTDNIGATLALQSNGKLIGVV